MAQLGSGGNSILTGLIYLVQEKDHQQMFQIQDMAGQRIIANSAKMVVVPLCICVGCMCFVIRQWVCDRVGVAIQW